MNDDWQPIATAPENVVVLTKIDDASGSRNETSLKRKGRLWWYPDEAMYVYYTPTHWQPLVLRVRRPACHQDEGMPYSSQSWQRRHPAPPDFLFRCRSCQTFFLKVETVPERTERTHQPLMVDGVRILTGLDKSTVPK